MACVCVTSIMINSSVPPLTPGQTWALSATAYPSNATNKTLTWFSDNENIATVNASTGLVTARSVGTTTVTAMATDGSGVTADFQVTVKSGTVPVTSVLMNRFAITIAPCDTFPLSAAVFPSNATNQSLCWSSSRPSVATVNSSSGLVTAHRTGSAVITATAKDGSGHSDYCEVTVENDTVLVTSVSVSPSSRELTLGGSFYASATVCPGDASNKSVCWTSSKESVATVNPDSGLVIAQGNGTTTITATAKDGSYKKGSCFVTVSSTIPVSSVTLDASARTMTPNTFFTLTTTVCPTYATDKEVCWTSSNPGVATVDSGGKVCALKAGTAVIRATAADGSGQSDSCTVTVKASTVLTTSVSVSPPCKQLSPGESFYATATVLPTNASNRSVCWSSSNTNVATVNPNSGLVIARNDGSSIITATATDGSGSDGTCSISVSSARLRLAMSCLTLSIDSTYKIRVYNEHNKDIYWTSSNPKVAEVDCSSGLIRAKRAGSAKITASTTDNTEKDTCFLSVNQKRFNATFTSALKNRFNTLLGSGKREPAIIHHYTPAECIDIILSYDSLITNLCNTSGYLVPKAIVQSLLLRELWCVNATDDVADTLVIEYFSYMQQYEDWSKRPTWEQVIIPPPTAPLPMHTDSSTGLGQMFAATGISAHNNAINIGLLTDSSYMSAEDWHVCNEMWYRLFEDNDFAIKMVYYEIFNCARKNNESSYDFFEYSSPQIKALLSRYNGSGTEAQQYGNEVYEYYLIFSEFNDEK